MTNQPPVAIRKPPKWLVKQAAEEGIEHASQVIYEKGLEDGGALVKGSVHKRINSAMTTPRFPGRLHPELDIAVLGLDPVVQRRLAEKGFTKLHHLTDSTLMRVLTHARLHVEDLAHLLIVLMRNGLQLNDEVPRLHPLPQVQPIAHPPVQKQESQQKPSRSKRRKYRGQGR